MHVPKAGSSRNAVCTGPRVLLRVESPLDLEGNHPLENDIRERARVQVDDQNEKKPLTPLRPTIFSLTLTFSSYILTFSLLNLLVSSKSAGHRHTGVKSLYRLQLLAQQRVPRGDSTK